MEDYLLFFVLITAFLSLLGWVRYKKIINPITLFCGLWTIILFAYSLHIFGLYYASDSVLWSIVIGTIMFYFGGTFRSRIKSKYY